MLLVTVRRMKRLSNLEKAKELAKSKTKLPPGGSLTLLAITAVSVAAAVGIGLYSWDHDKKSRRRFNYV
jgi:uncharacterized protein HemX